MYGLSFDKANVIIACCKDIYGRYDVLKKVKMITFTIISHYGFKMKSFSFLVFRINSTAISSIGKCFHLFAP